MSTTTSWIAFSFVAFVVPRVVAAPPAPGGTGEPASPYTFFLDGKPTTFPTTTVAGRPGELAPGDVIHVSGIPLTLGTQRECHFRSAPEGVLLELPNGSTRWIGVRVRHTFDGGYHLVDGMASLSEEQVRGLWGLRAEAWTASCAQKVAWLDGPRVSVSLGETGSRGTKDLPALPRGLRYLKAMRFLGWKNLSNLQDLVFLDAHPDDDLDLRLLQGLSHLRFLRLYGIRKLEHIEALADLAALESLDLAFHDNLTDLRFAAGLSRLREIRLSDTKVQDLTPLSGLSLLETVDAKATPVTRLPDGALPALRALNVVGAPVSEGAVAAFRRAHPAALVQHDWNEALRDAIVGATRLRIASNPLDGRPTIAGGTLYETTDAAEIARLATLLTIDERATNRICGCICGPDFEFRRGTDLLATASFVCENLVRWEGWPADGALPAEQVAALIDWLARRGVTGPRDEARKDNARAKAYERETRRASAGMSQGLRDAFERDGRIVGQTAAMPKQASFPPALAKEFPTAADRIRALLRIYGAANDWGGGLSWEHQIAEHLLRGYPRRRLESACEAALLGDDRQVRRGAARLWRSSSLPLAHWRPTQLTRLRSVLLTVMQESRSPAQRQDALSALQQWWWEMPIPEREQRLQAGLHDPNEAVRRRAMLVAGQVGGVAVEDLLLRQLAGEPIEPIPLPPVPAEEEDSANSGAESIARESPVSEVAAVALGYLRSRRALPLIEERAAASSSAMLRVARALQDDKCDLLAADDFRTQDRNQALQLAAVESVVRCRGRRALDLALAYRQASDWWEEDHVAGELKRMLLAAHAPGAATLKTVKTLPELRGWYQLYGPEYLRRIQAR